MQEVEQLRQEKLQIDQELRSYNGPMTMHNSMRRPFNHMDGYDGHGMNNIGGRDRNNQSSYHRGGPGGGGRGYRGPDARGPGRGGYGKKVKRIHEYDEAWSAWCTSIFIFLFVNIFPGSSSRQSTPGESDERFGRDRGERGRFRGGRGGGYRGRGGPGSNHRSRDEHP